MSNPGAAVARAIIQQESAETWREEGLRLFEQHRQEISHYQDIPLDIDLASYLKAEEIGALRCYTARVDGQLVGYCVLFVRHNVRYRSSLQAVQDVLYLDPRYRGRSLGVRLILFAERALQAEGVQVIYQHVKASRSEGRLFEALGYECIDHVYGKRLDREGTHGR